MKILYTLYVVFCSLSVFAQKNKIKTEEQTFFDKKNKITGYKIIDYDTVGNEIVVKYLNTEKNVESSSMYEFNNNNILIKETNYDAEGKVEDVWNHYIDENGEDTLIKYGFPKRNEYYFEKYKNTYNKEKKVIKQERCQNNDTVNFVYHYSYDSSGNELSCVSFLYGNPSEDYYYKYDNRGNMIEEKLYSPNDEGKQEINTIWEYFYDDDNLKIKEKTSSLASYLSAKTLNIYSFEYKKENHLPIEKTDKKNNIFEKKTKYKYIFY